MWPFKFCWLPLVGILQTTILFSDILDGSPWWPWGNLPHLYPHSYLSLDHHCFLNCETCPGGRWPVFMWQSLFPTKAWFTFATFQHCNNGCRDLGRAILSPRFSLVAVTSIVLCCTSLWLILVLTEHQNEEKNMEIRQKVKKHYNPPLTDNVVMVTMWPFLYLTII